MADSSCVSALNYIVRRGGSVLESDQCRIVLSSSWRFCGTEEMRLILKHWGVAGELLDCTPDLTRSPESPGAIYVGVPRSREIQAWLDANEKPESYVIIDDDLDADIAGRLIKTQFDVGLTLVDAKRANDMLCRNS